MRPIDVYDDELAAMAERVAGGMDADSAARVTAGYSRSGVTPERLAQLYPTWSALATAGEEL